MATQINDHSMPTPKPIPASTKALVRPGGEGRRSGRRWSDDIGILFILRQIKDIYVISGFIADSAEFTKVVFSSLNDR